MLTRRNRAGICLIALVILATACMQLFSRSQQMIAIPVICVVMIFAFAMALGAGGNERPFRNHSPDYGTVAAKLDEIEQEMKVVGLWQEEPLAPEKYNFTRAFAMDTMSYDQWLQFVFLPRVRDIISTKGKFPASSSVGAQAVREFDAYPNAGGLITLLSEFDRLFWGMQRRGQHSLRLTVRMGEAPGCPIAGFPSALACDPNQCLAAAYQTGSATTAERQGTRSRFAAQPP